MFRPLRFLFSQDHSVPPRTAFAHGCNPDGRFVFDGAFILTDTTADTLGRIQERSFQLLGTAIPASLRHRLVPDGLGRGWTHFLADDTGGIHGPRQTASSIEEGGPQCDGSMEWLSSYFFLHRYGSYGACGADLSAQHAVMFAVADPIDENRSPQSFEAGFQQSWLQHVGGTNPHAGGALDASGQEIPLIQRSGGTDDG